ncbi:MAG TPA: CmcI family methyltransferase [Isosphaeraceae bacterium]|nr:CmcI family methyltransferase [Isosphaeraceae bacterium]
MREYRVIRRPKRQIVDDFHKLYYLLEPQTWGNTKWFGTDTLKCPFDLWTYQEILHEVQPDLIVETGTWGGGSALFLASMFDLMNRGSVVTIDIEEKPGRPQHQRITYMLGSSTAPEIVQRVRSMIGADDRVLVILDSDHSKDHVLRELEIYSDLVTPGSYVIVEDSNVNGHPVSPSFGPGPMEALREFLGRDQRFEIDRTREKFMLTFNPSGYLRRTG